jgi:hypothetical protein
MMYITPSVSHTGQWRLGEQELVPDDVIELLLLNTWYRAQVQQSGGPQEYRLLIAGHPYSMPLVEGRTARWPENDHKADGEGKTVEKPGD